MSEKKSVTVRIAGEEHTIRAEAEPAYTRACAKLVDDRIQEMRARAGLIENHRLAILAALSITDELLQARDDLDRLEREVTTRAEALSDRIGQVLDETATNHE
ncbi:MAG: cell division protein ZapA [Longimicrobiales bacterium]|nr:cell division protein ZapA [Longimicrobiales bacterium]